MAAPYIEHIVSRIKADLDFLESQSLITRADKDAALARLPTADVRSVDSKLSNLTLSSATNNNPGQRTMPARPGSVMPPPPPPRAQAKANWAYNSGDPQDLVFQEGDVIDIVEETNGDWWKGRLNGREGLLPANYMTKLPPAPVRSPNPPAYTPDRTVYAPPPSEPKQYYPPTGNPPWAQQPPQPSWQQPPQPTWQQPPPQPSWQQQPPPPQPQPVQQDPPKQSRFGGLGQVMATSAAGGLGFGAGAAIGGDLVNAIF
ncbi:SH3-domain-containing protein [Dacryopinax primogenitus]|uniref:SH3-domain-containing protein n=1 Tax=Dacryopinax primogenitus (strain DJM 731) TaxID=1858805 RepID=M5GDV0_DACPD|nr:SH3-domain-containing protein [Dacryopinax primogenitus]EJU02703.1 SH3-domain-containing protein [Dacryopinax primogenitus]